MQLGDFTRNDDRPLGTEYLDDLFDGIGYAGGSFVENQGTRRVAEVFQGFCPLAFFTGKKSEEAKCVSGQAAGYQRTEEGRGARDGNHRDVVSDGESDETKSRVGNTGHAGVTHQSDIFSLLQLHDQFGGARKFVVLVIAGGRRVDAVMIEELLRLTGVFAGDQLDFFQGADGAKSDVFQVSDGRTNEV